jgi:hypothetical protein
MRSLNRPRRGSELLFAAIFLCLLLTTSQGFGSEYGRISGRVTDSSGKPVMGATVLLLGPGIDGPNGLLDGSLNRVFTDSRGRFTIGHVTPGWYSLQVISPAKLPGFRGQVHVRAGATTLEAFTLGDFLTGIHLQKPSSELRSWENEWKWILRTSASTRPVLRYRKADHDRKKAAERPTLPPVRVFAMVPATVGANGLSQDAGTDAVVAYLHSLDPDSDVLVAGSVNRSDLGGSSVVADYRRGFLKRNHQEISLAVHQLNMDGNDVAVTSANGQGVPMSRAMVLRYVQTRQLSDALTVTAGVEMQYLNSVRDASSSQPEIDLAYRLNPSTVLHLHYGMGTFDQRGTLLERIGDLNAFPQITLQNFHPRLEEVRHAELRMEKKLGRKARLEFAAYHDAFHNVAVWSTGGVQELNDSFLAGNALVSPSANRAVLNAGGYGSSGGEAGYERQLGQEGEIGVMYAFGRALAATPSAGGVGMAMDAANLPEFVRAEFTQTVSGRFSERIPVLKTQIISSYSWVPAGRVTLVDPYGQNRMEFQPFWGLQVRQPLPKIDILPMRIVAIADFRNLLGQGSMPLRQADGRSILLTPAYRTIRGGFAVQF